jgi:hypothetical protein
VSPASHSAFSTPDRDDAVHCPAAQLSGGKPTGFKLCIGHPWEWFAMVKAMLATGITPDFIVVDGAEGGTGAAPWSSPTTWLAAAGGPAAGAQHAAWVWPARQNRVGCAGKVVSAFDIVRMMALGADWCNSARGFMFALGCMQAQHLPHRPLPHRRDHAGPAAPAVAGGARQGQRVYNFHEQTLQRVGRAQGTGAGRRAAAPGDITAAPHRAPQFVAQYTCVMHESIDQMLANILATKSWTDVKSFEFAVFLI